MSAPRPQALAGFFTLLLIALMMAANHVAARLAFDHGTHVTTAVAVRSLGTALAVGALLAWARVPLRLNPRQRRALPFIGLLVGVQSLCLYAAVARLPVVLALLVFNSFPILAALWARLLYGQRPERRVLLAMPVILVGLVLALDVLGAASGLGAGGQWQRMGAGVAFALVGAGVFGLALVLIEREAAGLDGRWRTFTTMAVVGLLASGAALQQGGFAWPQATAGWWGLALLTLLYGTGITLLFTVLPRLGVVGNSAVLNVEPVFALAIAWLVLGQTVAPAQLLGALLVVAAIVTLGLRRR